MASISSATIAFVDNLALHRRYITAAIKSQLQYRASFLLTLLGNLVATGIEFFGIWALFNRFGSIKGWRLPEIALFYGVVNVAFAIAEAVGRGFDTFPTLVKSGDFDRILLRPRSTALQVMGGELQLMRMGRLAQGLAVLLWAMHTLHIAWTGASTLLILCTILGGVCIFFGLLVLQAAMSFWTIETLEIMNTVTYGGTETGQYPLTIYRPWFRRFFTFVVPLAFANYLPLSIILGHNDVVKIPGMVVISPLVGILFLSLSLVVWRIGVRHYHSTGS